MKEQLLERLRKHSRTIGAVALGIVMMMLMVCTWLNFNDNKHVHNVHVEYKGSEIHNLSEKKSEDVHNGHLEQVMVDYTVNPFIDTSNQVVNEASKGGGKSGNYRNLPAIPAVYPTSQPRPVLPLPSIPRTAPQQQAIVASAPAPANAGEAAPKENKEAQIAFLGGGDIMFAHGMDSGN